MEESGEAYASLDGAGGVFAVELGAFGVIVGFFECPREQVLHVDGVVEELARGGAAASAEKVAAAELFWCEADDFGDLVHVALEGEDALRCAEAAEGSVGRDVGCHCFGADGQIRPVDMGRERGWFLGRGRLVRGWRKLRRRWRSRFPRRGVCRLC